MQIRFDIITVERPTNNNICRYEFGIDEGHIINKWSTIDIPDIKLLSIISDNTIEDFYYFSASAIEYYFPQLMNHVISGKCFVDYSAYLAIISLYKILIGSDDINICSQKIKDALPDWISKTVLAIENNMIDDDMSQEGRAKVANELKGLVINN